MDVELELIDQIINHDLVMGVGLLTMITGMAWMGRIISVLRKELTHCIESRQKFVAVLERNHLVKEGEFERI